MTDANNPDEDGTVDRDLDTTDGTRSPLTTDDGLAAVAEQMPTVQSTAPATSEDCAEHRELQDAPGLDVQEDGTDPLACLAEPEPAECLTDSGTEVA